MSLWVPPQATRRMEEGRRQYIADVLSHVGLEGTLDYWNRELKKIDVYLELVKAQERTTVPGLKPGFYHILRHNPGAPPTIEPWENPDGSFREPDEGIFKWLAERDLWSDRPQHERKKAKRAAEREAQRTTEDRRQEMLERLQSKMRTSVHIRKAIS